MATIKGIVTNFIDDTYQVQIVMNEVDLGPDDSILASEIMDSVGVLEFVSFVEDTFGIKVGEEEVTPDNFDSINKIVAYVESKGGKAKE